MSKFFGCEFIFDGVPSRNYDLRILDFKSSGVDSYDAGSESEIIQKKIFRRSRPYFYGRSTNKNLEFDLTIGSLDPISANDRSAINSWLLGRMEYLPLQIIQSDMSSIFFYVIFDKSSNQYVGNINRAMTFHVFCRDPWGFEESKNAGAVYGSGVTNETFYFFNGSADSDYLKPIITVSTNGTGSYFSFMNVTDNNRVFSFSDLIANEIITVDNDLEIISSDTGLLRMSNFNKKFFRLVPGMNEIWISGTIEYFIITYQFAKKI